ncbi:MAG: DUF1553 domain-containing protein [Planctomycetes bacterium]|nr:DUF1553 domain-containing protein [Planctomycetota bacterium]
MTSSDSIVGPGRAACSVRACDMVLVGVLAWFGTASGRGSCEEPAIDFGRRIRPVLAERCFPCHGLDAEKRETDMRLDTKEGLFVQLDSGDIPIVPGDPDRSALYRRLTTDDPELRMPPDDAKPLDAEEIERIRQWIADGARWEPHWSLTAPSRPSVPDARGSAWPRNAIDAFILQRLRAEELEPSSEADKARLLRRAALDLTGLPPTIAELDAFLTDPSADAYEKAVDRLLASPHYGEQMARYWLDAARYGDTHGLHLDNVRLMWPYRDWVIRAFRDNMPFDRFTLEQLAGDLLPDATLQQRIATGFLRCNVTTSEGGAIDAEYEAHYTADRVATVSTVWMGITMGCVVCHDHKFDPFDMKDHYQLAAFFNRLDGPAMDGNRQDTPPTIQVMTDDQRRELEQMDARVADLVARIAAPQPAVDAAQGEWESRIRTAAASEPRWMAMRPESSLSRGGATLAALEDHSILASGVNPEKEVYEFEFRLQEGPFTAIRLEGLTHESLSGGGAGRSPNGNVVLTEFEAETAASDGSGAWQSVSFALAWSDHAQSDGDFKIANAIDGKPESGWAIGGHQKKEDRRAIFVASNPFGGPEGARLRVRLRHESIYAQHQFGRVRLAVTAAAAIPEVGVGTVPRELVDWIRGDPASVTEEQRGKIRTYYRDSVSTDGALKAAINELASLRKARDAFDAGLPTTLVWRDAGEPKPAFILLRGQYDKPGPAVSPNTPAALPPLADIGPGHTPTRIDLARWLVSPEHPLTARVVVNRFWQQYFGIGLVETAEDFGSQGTPPSHPELLDWLAVEFRESGWDVKRLQKLIVTSAAYRQDARVTPDRAKKDPRNRLVSRGPRYRLDAESVRDSALAASGLLVRDIGGPSVKPYQPSGIWEAVAYTDSNTAKFTRDSGPALYRRGLYTFWKRTAPPPTLVILDAPSRETCTVRRTRTNTPLAALALMNDEQFVEAARHLATRALKEGGSTDAERVAYAFRLATARVPTDAERAVLHETLSAHADRYAADVESARKLIQVGESAPDATLDPAQLAAWTMLGNLILNLDESITK